MELDPPPSSLFFSPPFLPRAVSYRQRLRGGLAGIRATSRARENWREPVWYSMTRTEGFRTQPVHLKAVGESIGDQHPMVFLAFPSSSSFVSSLLLFYLICLLTFFCLFDCLLVYSMGVSFFSVIHSVNQSFFCLSVFLYLIPSFFFLLLFFLFCHYLLVHPFITLNHHEVR